MYWGCFITTPYKRSKIMLNASFIDFSGLIKWQLVKTRVTTFLYQRYHKISLFILYKEIYVNFEESKTYFKKTKYIFYGTLQAYHISQSICNFFDERPLPSCSLILYCKCILFIYRNWKLNDINIVLHTVRKALSFPSLWLNINVTYMIYRALHKRHLSYTVYCTAKSAIYSNLF